MPQQPPISFPMGTKNVLIIDSNEAMQELRACVLRSRGVHVHTAKSVTEAALLCVPDFFDWYCWTCARDPQKQWSSGERFGDSIQGSGSVSWSDPQHTCLPPAPTKSSPATRFPKTGCRGQESCMSHKPYRPIAVRWKRLIKEKIHETGAFD